MVAKLTEKQKRFADEYLVDLNATQAATRAGYSEKTAYSQGCRLLNDVEIQKYIQKRLAEKDKKIIADQDEVLSTLTRILRREENEHVVITKKKRKSYYDKAGKKVIKEEDEAEAVPIPPKLTDVNKAAELLGKYYSLYTDRTDINGDLNFSIEVDYGEEESKV